ncbi:MAG: hypothetical protein LBU51_09760 [Bacteroidales bacterium]|jgi:hypothetical protein|nr:hypothetical protein [Bacteroidales bacterium]
MKNLIHFLLLITAVSMGHLKAQTFDYTTSYDSVFAQVSRTGATTGILYNRVLPFSGLTQFTQPDMANTDIFVQAFSELYEAAFLPAARLPFSVDSLPIECND